MEDRVSYEYKESGKVEFFCVSKINTFSEATVNVSDITEEVREKMAILDLVPVGTKVTGLGYKSRTGEIDLFMEIDYFILSIPLPAYVEPVNTWDKVFAERSSARLLEAIAKHMRGSTTPPPSEVF